MSEASERYRRLSGEFAARIAAVPPDRWDSPTPCDGWTARDLVQHVVETQGRFLGAIGRELGPVPDVADDPDGAWEAARAVVQADLDDPERATTGYEGYFGRTTFQDTVDNFGNLDLVVHGWDLARATGQDERLDPDDVRWVSGITAELADAARQAGAFGPAVEAPPDADEQTRLLAFLGRRP